MIFLEEDFSQGEYEKEWLALQRDGNAEDSTTAQEDSTNGT